jgi:hypothetical protein
LEYLGVEGANWNITLKKIDFRHTRGAYWPMAHPNDKIEDLGPTVHWLGPHPAMGHAAGGPRSTRDVADYS